MSEPRLYVPGVDEFDRDGYPLAWQTIKNDVRAAAEHRCVRCGHPYRNGQHGRGEWSRCDRHCTHETGGRMTPKGWEWLTRLAIHEWVDGSSLANDNRTEASWRILTVHHLDGDKANCRWWNLAALCQRCHLTIQGRVQMARVWPWEHSEWFRPYVAGYYAWTYLGEDLTRGEAEARMDDLLALERVA